VIAAITDDRKELRYWSDPDQRQTEGKKPAEANGKRNRVGGELLVTVIP
jgi:hypothetical protein